MTSLYINLWSANDSLVPCYSIWQNFNCLFQIFILTATVFTFQNSLCSKVKPCSFPDTTVDRYYLQLPGLCRLIFFSLLLNLVKSISAVKKIVFLSWRRSSFAIRQLVNCVFIHSWRTARCSIYVSVAEVMRTDKSEKWKNYERCFWR